MSYIYIRKDVYRLIVKLGYDPKDYINDLLKKELIEKGSEKGV